MAGVRKLRTSTPGRSRIFAAWAAAAAAAILALKAIVYSSILTNDGWERTLYQVEADRYSLIGLVGLIMLALLYIFSRNSYPRTDSQSRLEPVARRSYDVHSKAS